MKILALEPYFGGSHQAFLEGWSSRSRHNWTILSLPAYHWKWRMRHAAVTLAKETADKLSLHGPWDIVFCSDMLNLAEYQGLAPNDVSLLPVVAYFHENQLTYPVRRSSERDNHFAFTNFLTALSANSVWFNSQFHLDSFCEALTSFLSRMPDYNLLDELKVSSEAWTVFPPGIDSIQERPSRIKGPLHILWSARWEHDKNPEDFFAAIDILYNRGVDFRLLVLGESFREVPEIFSIARNRYSNHIDRWGYQDSRIEYNKAILESDVVVSTARHEFFGIAVAEAVAAGAYPVLPRRLAYPELLGLQSNQGMEKFFYDGTPESLAEKLINLSNALLEGDAWKNDVDLAQEAIKRFTWTRLVPKFDTALEDISIR